MSHLIGKKPGTVLPVVVRGEGVWAIDTEGNRWLDATSGKGSNTLGYDHPEVIEALHRQAEKVCFANHSYFASEAAEELADLLCRNTAFNHVYLAGQSGSEGTEAAIKLSYQAQHDSGKKAKHIISRRFGYHGSTLGSHMVSDLPSWKFFEPIAKDQPKIMPFWPMKAQKPEETLDQFSDRAADALENKILELGAENVFAFIAETLVGSTLGDLAANPRYWGRVRDICTRHNVHLILDEIYCGMGRAGTMMCYEQDGIVPDIAVIGKGLGAGYVPSTALLVGDPVLDAILTHNPQKMIHYGHTHVGHNLGCAVAVAVQKVISRDGFVAEVAAKGDFFRERLRSGLEGVEEVYEVRGRGLLNSVEFNTDPKQGLSNEVIAACQRQRVIIKGGPFHVSATPPLVTTYDALEMIADTMADAIKAALA